MIKKNKTKVNRKQKDQLNVNNQGPQYVCVPLWNYTLSKEGKGNELIIEREREWWTKYNMNE